MNALVPRWILAPNPSPMTLDGTRTYLVGVHRPIVIDPGPSIPAHVDAVMAALGGATPVAIVCTHSHADHAGAASALAAATGAPIRSAAGPADGGPHRSAGTDRASSHENSALDARPGVRQEFTLESDAGELRILPTPGHAPDHVSLHWTVEGAPNGGVAFVGDLLMGAGDTTLVGFPEGNVADYFSSLGLIESLECATLYPAHGPPLSAPEAIHRHREHRLRRVAQIQRLIAQHPGVDTDTLVDLAYGDALDQRLRTAARASVRAIENYLGTVIDQAPRER